MARRYYSSIAARTTLSSSITSTAVTMGVVAVSGWPSSFPYTLIIDSDLATEEVVTVTGRSGLTVTIVRGVDGTTGQAHDAGSPVQHGVSARDFDEPNTHDNTAVKHVTVVTSSSRPEALLLVRLFMKQTQHYISGGTVPLGQASVVHPAAQDYKTFSF